MRNISQIISIQSDIGFGCESRDIGFFLLWQRRQLRVASAATGSDSGALKAAASDSRKHHVSTSISSYTLDGVSSERLVLSLRFLSRRDAIPHRPGREFGPHDAFVGIVYPRKPVFAAGKQHSTIAVRMSRGGKIPRRCKQVSMAYLLL